MLEDINIQQGCLYISQEQTIDAVVLLQPIIFVFVFVLGFLFLYVYNCFKLYLPRFLYLYFSAGNRKGCLQISQVRIMDVVVLLQPVILGRVYLSGTTTNNTLSLL